MNAEACVQLGVRFLPIFGYPCGGAGPLIVQKNKLRKRENYLIDAVFRRTWIYGYFC